MPDMVNKSQCYCWNKQRGEKSRKICKSLFGTSLTTDDDDISANICYEKKTSITISAVLGSLNIFSSNSGSGWSVDHLEFGSAV